MPMRLRPTRYKIQVITVLKHSGVTVGLHGTLANVSISEKSAQNKLKKTIKVSMYMYHMYPHRFLRKIKLASTITRLAAHLQPDV